ncbi:MAG: recombinase family protein [Actinomycetota bacterium]|nr:recombinase family protein [Actinomycetota bacterium]
MRVATYTRISTDEDHQPYSLEAQAERLGAYVKSQPDWELTRRFGDQASGATTERPGLHRALAEARADRFDLLLVYRVDRFSRNVRGLAQLLEDLDAAGVAFRSATEPFDTTTAAGRMMVQMLGVFAEFERATIVDRVIAGMERKAALGRLVRRIAALRLRHRPPHRLPRAPVRRGTARTGHLRPLRAWPAWRPGARGVAQRGWSPDQGRQTLEPHGRPHRAAQPGLRRQGLLPRRALHDGPHPHLVDDKLFERVQALLSERGENYSKRASATSPFLLAGLVVCARCGKHFVGTSAVGNRYRYRYYTCFSRQRYGTKFCDAERLPAEELDAAILDSRCSTSTSEPISSTGPSRPRATGRVLSRRTATRNWRSSTPGSRRLRTRSSATSRRSRPAPCPKSNAASACSSSPRR